MPFSAFAWLRNALCRKVVEPARKVPTTPEALAWYRTFLAETAAASDGAVLFSNVPDRMPLVVAQMFRSGHNLARVVCPALDPAIFENAEAIDAIAQFLERNPLARLSILTETPVAPDHPLLATLRDRSLTSQVDLRPISTVKAALFACAFILVDDDKCRLQPEKDKPFALAIFGDPSRAKSLIDAFERLAA